MDESEPSRRPRRSLTVLIRADSGVTQGTGHVMRCLSLAEALIARGHRVLLMTAPIVVDWLAEAVEGSGCHTLACEPDSLDRSEIMAEQPDWVVVDSYRISASAISQLRDTVRVLAIVDGDLREIEATLYLDQNLGAERVRRDPAIAGRMLAGSRFALVRNSILAARRSDPWTIGSRTPSVLCFMGGTDPSGATLHVVAALMTLSTDFSLTVIAPISMHDSITAIGDGRVILSEPTPELPRLLGASDVVISGAGTSAWDICALGLPALLIAVVDNQSGSVREITRTRVALGFDAARDRTRLDTEPAVLVGALLSDESLRRELSERATAAVDGRGKARIVERMEDEAQRE